MEKENATQKRFPKRRKQADEALRESKATIQTIIDAMPEFAILVDAKGTVLAVNMIAAQQLGKSQDGIIGRSIYNLLPPDVAQKRAEKLKELLVSGQPVCFADGRSGRNYYNRFYPVLDSKGNVEKAVIFTQDLTMRHQTELTLRESEERYRQLFESEQRFKSIFENAPIGFYRTTPGGRILDANPTLVKMLGYFSFEELASINLETSEYPPEYPRQLFRERIARDGEIKGMESFWKRPDNTLVYIRENAIAIRDPNGNIVCYEGTIEDITDRKQAEEQIRTLSQQLIKAQETERQMISRELHDRIAQDLSTLKIGCDTLFDDQTTVPPEVRKKVSQFAEILHRTIVAVRDLAYDLRPPGLEEMGLVAVLSAYCEEFSEKGGVKVDFQSAGMKNVRLDSDTEINLYRLIQEGLNNIRKHAGASRATIKLLGASPNIILRIEDEGKGFDMEARIRTQDGEKRMGLRSMAERVSLLQGKMTIQSRPLEGTQIIIKFPYQEKKTWSPKRPY